MTSTTWILLGVAALVLYLYFKYKKAQGVPILKVSVGTSDDINYQVEFTSIHPDVKQIEYVRMALNFTTKILYVVEPNKSFLKTEIIDFITQIAKTNLKQEELDTIIKNKIKVSEGTPSGKIIQGTLYFQNVATRSIFTSMPVTWYEKQLVNSVYAVLYACVQKLDELHKEFLLEALAFLGDAYNNKNIDPSSIRSMAQLPNEAFAARWHQ